MKLESNVVIPSSLKVHIPCYNTIVSQRTHGNASMASGRPLTLGLSQAKATTEKKKLSSEKSEKLE